MASNAFRFSLAAAWAALVLAAPVSAQQAADLYGEGVAARHAGDPARAADLLARLVAAEPENSDAHLQLGLALLALGRLDEAEGAFQETLRLAPDYADARIGLARVAQRRGDRRAALAALEPLGPANPEAAALRASLRGAAGEAGASAPGQVRLDVDLSYSDLDSPRADWREGAVRLQYQALDDIAVTGLVELSDRGAVSDVYLEARLDARLGAGRGVYVSLGGAPNADFRPEWQIGAGGFARVRGGADPTVLTLDARQARYASGDVQTLSPGVEQYLGGGRLWLTARWINIFDEDGDHHAGWLARGDVMASDRLRLFAGLADAPDTSEGVVVDTFSLFGGLSYELNPRSLLRLSIAHEDRETGSDRLQINLGTGLRF
jgi:YaiO family outer membrane protein